MSKVDKLKERYPRISEKIFNYFNDNDLTPTKKYLEFYLITWSNVNRYQKLTINELREVVHGFDELLPYIENKDIYSEEYKDFSYLQGIVEEAQTKREKNQFVKNDHIFIIHECPEYIFLMPKTHVGSLKYGASTKWCTASRDNESTFKSYSKNFLVYLIDKTGLKHKNGEKLAFYSASPIGLCDGYQIYDVTDKTINTDKAVEYGWTYDILFELDIRFREFIRTKKVMDDAKRDVEKIIKALKEIKFEETMEKVRILEIGANETELRKKLNSAIETFIERIPKNKDLLI